MTSSKCDPVSKVICNILAAYRLIMEVNLLTLKTRSNGYWPPFCFVENSDLICSSMTIITAVRHLLYFLRLTSVCHSSHFSVIGNTESSHVHLESHFDINFSQITDVFPLTVINIYNQKRQHCYLPWASFKMIFYRIKIIFTMPKCFFRDKPFFFLSRLSWSGSIDMLTSHHWVLSDVNLTFVSSCTDI